MKNIAFFIFLFFSIQQVCIAQNNSKIIFFREDIPFHFKGVPFSIYMYGENKKANNPSSFFVFDTPKDTGIYYLDGFKKKKLTVSTSEKSITFVAIKINFFPLSNKHPIRKVTLDDFKNAYNHKKWLRKKMAKAGYKSVDDIISGYKVND